MTPCAVLLVKPNDSDETVRRAYHAIARHCHPDACRGLPTEAQDKLRTRWHSSTEAYAAVKTAEDRAAWAAKTALLSGVCKRCGGCGTLGTRMFKGVVRVCDACKGEGRT